MPSSVEKGSPPEVWPRSSARTEDGPRDDAGPRSLAPDDAASLEESSLDDRTLDHGSEPRPRRAFVAGMRPGDEDLDLTFSDANVTIDAHEDRWHWRRKIRMDPRKLVVYRVVVGIVGVFFVALGFVTGPLPGPGGIPLVLLGLAILASEFEWAHRLMQYFKAQLHRFRQWTRPKQVLFWLVFVACCGLFGYTYMLVFGVPGWVPSFVDRHLTLLPGL